MAESKVTSKGQITIPAETRKAMGLKPQDRVVFAVLHDGAAVMRAKSKSVEDLKAMLRRRGKRLSVSDMGMNRSQRSIPT